MTPEPLAPEALAPSVSTGCSAGACPWARRRRDPGAEHDSGEAHAPLRRFGCFGRDRVEHGGHGYPSGGRIEHTRCAREWPGVVMWDWLATWLDFVPAEYRRHVISGVLAAIGVVGAILGGMIRGRFDRRKLQRMKDGL